MGIYCILCGKKDKSVSYLRFPTNKNLRRQWLKFCKRKEKYLYDSHRLCTDHFKPEDLKKHSWRIVAQPEAVPCIYSVNEHTSKIENTSNTDNCNISDLTKLQVNDNRNVVNYSQSTTVTKGAHCNNKILLLLVQHEVKAAETGNCMVNDNQILLMLANKEDTSFTEEKKVKTLSSANVLSDHEYLSTLCVYVNLSPYVDKVVTYISGFVVKKLLKDKNMCDICASYLTDSSQDVSKYALIEIKMRGKLQYPSHDVILITKTTERIIRANNDILFGKNIKEFLIVKTFQAITINHSVFNDDNMMAHIQSQETLNNHRTDLIKAIIQKYVVLRLYFERKHTLKNPIIHDINLT